MICLAIIFFVCLLNNASAQTRLHTYQNTLMPSGNYFKNNLLDTSSARNKINRKSIFVIPVDYYATTVGFFCKKELEMDKAIRLPLRFRLGSVAYTDKMEGKNMLLQANKKNN